MHTKDPPLVGRDVELAAIASTLEEAAAGTLKFVLIEGAAGVGKTRPMEEAVAKAGSPFELARGQGHELGRERPFGIIVDALDLDRPGGDSDRKAAARLLRESHGGPTDGESEYAEARFVAVEAMVTLVESRAKRSKILLTLDDLQWADASSLLAIDQITRRLSSHPIAIVATTRPTPRLPALDTLLRALPSDDSLRVSLDPLGRTETEHLTALMVGATPGPGLRRQIAGAAGNPFFISEMLRALGDEGRLTFEEHVAETTDDLPLPSLRALTLKRIGHLSPESLDVMRIAAVLGSRFNLDDLSVVLARPATTLIKILDEPTRSGFLVEAGYQLEFHHHLVWDALYHDLPLTSREALHVQVARRLADAGRPATQVATHFMAGASPGDSEAVDWLERAAAEALSKAPEVSAQLLKGAIDLVGPGTNDRDRLSVQLATALTWAGRIQEAEAILVELANRVPGPGDDVGVRLGLARVQILQGKPFAARSQYDLLANHPGFSGRRRARALTDRAVACLMSGDVVGADAAASEAYEAGSAISDDASICGALSARSWVANLRGDTQKAVDLGEEAASVAERSATSEAGRRYPHVFLGVVLCDADQLDRARRMFDTGRRMAEAYGDAWQLPIHYLGAALVDYYSGRLDDAVTALATGAELETEVGNLVLHVWSSALGAHIAIERDELDRAEELLAAAEQHVADAGPGMGYDWLLWGRSRLLAAGDDREAALAVLDNAWGLAGSLGIVSQRRLIGPDLFRLLRATGDVERAREVADTLAQVAALGGVRSSTVAAERCLALIEGDAGRAAAAVDLARDCPQTLEHARACEDAAQVMIDNDQEGEARPFLEEAYDLYLACGGRRGERRVDATLRRLGVTRGSRGRRDRPTTGWESLTPTELEVSALAAQGLTNPEIGRRLYISHRTVETHLSHVYGKLGISSRVELAARAASRTPVQGK